MSLTFPVQRHIKRLASKFPCWLVKLNEDSDVAFARGNKGVGVSSHGNSAISFEHTFHAGLLWKMLAE